MKYKFMNFMRGRNGPDELYHFLFLLYIITFILNIFLKNYFLSLLELILIFSIFYRFFSKNISKRRKENINFLELKKRIKNCFNRTDTNYIYKKCHHCKKTLRLPIPSNRGFKYVICPVCNKKNLFLIFRKVHIEVIKNKK